MMKFGSLISTLLVVSLLVSLQEAARLGQRQKEIDKNDNTDDQWSYARRRHHKLIQQTIANSTRRLEQESGRTVIVELSEQSLLKGGQIRKVQEEQDRVWETILEAYPTSQLVSSTQRLVNALYVRLPEAEEEDDDDDDTTVDTVLRQIEGVKEVSPHGNLEMDLFGAVTYVGSYDAREQFCATGKGVKVAVLDGGIDYTHFYLGGPGTIEAYYDAYGAGPRSVENRRRDDLFPTDVVVDGFDFIGEFDSIPIADGDPIDSFGHGTAVAHAIRTMAPNVELVALKVCSRSMACPLFSIIQGLEYALDPNGDNDTEDKVDIVNLSLGTSFVSPFYNFLAAAMETVAEFGTLPVVSAGNSGNVPYVMGGLSGSPNSISVGATENPSINAGVMANYSSRGPGDLNMMKPDIVAPSGLSLAAAGTGIYRFRQIQGTSFSAPLVAGAAAVVMERCPDCSPFAIKALLMNNARRTTQYHDSSDVLSPITLSGAGELQINKTLQTDLWMYSVEDVQPSISLGLINAASDLVIRRTLKIINLSGEAQTLQVGYAFRDPTRPFADALQVSFSALTVQLPESCNAEASVDVIFSIDASKAPPNHMTSTGRAGFNASGLDINEFGGHIVLASEETSKDISLPFLAIIRQASNVTIESPGITWESSEVEINLVNHGAGTAQIDSFQLLFVSEDEEESEFGDSVVPNDFRYIGYRTIPAGHGDCSTLLEFAITNWERKSGRLVTEIYGVEIDVDGDEEGDLVIFNTALARECLIADLNTNETYCTGFPPDHGTSSTNTILRACAEDLGIEDLSGEIGIRVEAIVFDHQGEIVSTDTTGDSFTQVGFPQARLAAPSYDVYPGETLQTIQVDVSGDGSAGLGLMLVTNSYRRPNSTGAATPMTETLLVLQGKYDSQRLPEEITSDILEFPKAQDLNGPDCSWKEIDPDCDSTLALEPGDDLDDEGDDVLESTLDGDNSMLDPLIPMLANRLAQGDDDEEESTSLFFCPAERVPRAEVLRPSVPVF